MPAPKGHPQWGHTIKGTKHKKTLEKEERRRVLDELVSQKWKPIIEELIETDKKYIADQFIGKPIETLKVEEDITIKLDA